MPEEIQDRLLVAIAIGIGTYIVDDLEDLEGLSEFSDVVQGTVSARGFEMYLEGVE